MGNALGIAQFGGTAPAAKPWKGLGPGVLEIVESHDGNGLYGAVPQSDLCLARVSEEIAIRNSDGPARH